jgi:hypothetical protein
MRNEADRIYITKVFHTNNILSGYINADGYTNDGHLKQLRATLVIGEPTTSDTYIWPIGQQQAKQMKATGDPAPSISDISYSIQPRQIALQPKDGINHNNITTTITIFINNNKNTHIPPRTTCILRANDTTSALRDSLYDHCTRTSNRHYEDLTIIDRRLKTSLPKPLHKLFNKPQHTSQVYIKPAIRLTKRSFPLLSQYLDSLWNTAANKARQRAYKSLAEEAIEAMKLTTKAIQQANERFHAITSYEYQRQTFEYLKSATTDNMLTMNTIMDHLQNLRNSPTPLNGAVTMSEEEISEMASTIYKNYHIHINKETKNYTMTLHTTKDTMYLLYHLPAPQLLTDAKLFHIQPLQTATNPILTTTIDEEYVIIIQQYYTFLKPHELSNCLDNKQCHSTKPLHHKTKHTCVTDTYYNIHPSSCHLKPKNTTKGQFILTDNSVIYSLPKPTTVTEYCFNVPAITNPKNSSMETRTHTPPEFQTLKAHDHTLQGMGELIFNGHCLIHTPSNLILRPTHTMLPTILGQDFKLLTATLVDIIQNGTNPDIYKPRFIHQNYSTPTWRSEWEQQQKISNLSTQLKTINEDNKNNYISSNYIMKWFHQLSYINQAIAVISAFLASFATVYLICKLPFFK